MAKPATLLANLDKAVATRVRARLHAEGADRQYRAALLLAFEGGINVTELARRRGTSWARMATTLDRAKAERVLD